MIILHGASASPFVRKVLVALAMKQLPFEHVQQMPFTNDVAYRKLNPLGKIPTLQDEDLTVCDSSVICEYLDDAYPQTPIYPQGSAAKARARWYEELGGTRVAELAAGLFFQRFMRPMVLKQETDEELVENIINKQLPPLLDYLETQVPADGFVFDTLMVADISLASPFVNAEYADYQLDDSRWPVFSDFFVRVKAHPLVAQVLDAEAKIMGRG